MPDFNLASESAREYQEEQAVKWPSFDPEHVTFAELQKVLDEQGLELRVKVWRGVVAVTLISLQDDSKFLYSEKGELHIVIRDALIKRLEHGPR